MQSQAAGTVFAVDALYPGTDHEKTVGRWLLPPGVEVATLDSPTRGRYLVRAQCAVCHTVDGFNALRHLSRGFDNPEFGRSTIETLHISKPFMPPFIGSDRDVDDVVRYLATLLEEDAR